MSKIKISDIQGKFAQVYEMLLKDFSRICYQADKEIEGDRDNVLQFTQKEAELFFASSRPKLEKLYDDYSILISLEIEQEHVKYLEREIKKVLGRNTDLLSQILHLYNFLMYIVVKSVKYGIVSDIEFLYYLKMLIQKLDVYMK